MARTARADRCPERGAQRCAHRCIHHGELLARARNGDEEAWNEIVHRYSGLVAASIRAVGIPIGLIDDVMQVTWMRMAASIHRIRDPEALRGWLWTSARNAAIDASRRESRLVATESFEHQEAVEVGPDEGLLAADTAEAVRGAVDDLNDRQRAVVVLRYLDDSVTSYAQIADRLDIRVGAIGPTLGRAMQQMRGHPRIAQLR